MTQARYIPNEFSLTTKDEIVAWLDEHYVPDYIINSDLSVDVDGNVSLVSLNLKHLPVQFGHVKGSFKVWYNELVSLNGSPHTVTGDFNCDHNRLTSLQGGPINVGSIFDCSHNRLTSLEFSPLTSLRFNCSNNCLTNLVGFAQAGKSYPGAFFASHNQLSSLEGAPIRVKDGFYCGFNSLTDLMYCPEEISGYGIFNFQNNPITSLDYFPQIGHDDVMCSNTGELVKKISQGENIPFKDFKKNLDIYKIEQEKINLDKSLALNHVNHANINNLIHKI